MFPDQSKGFKELHRVLKPGGKAAVTSWTTNQFFFNMMKKARESISFTWQSPPFSNRLGDKKLFEEDMIAAGFKDGKTLIIAAICLYLVVIYESVHKIDVDGNELVNICSGNPMFQDLEKILTPDQMKELVAALVEAAKTVSGTESVALIGVGTK